MKDRAALYARRALFDRYRTANTSAKFQPHCCRPRLGLTALGTIFNFKPKAALIILNVLLFTSGGYGLQISEAPNSSGEGHSKAPVSQGATSLPSPHSEAAPKASELEPERPSEVSPLVERSHPPVSGFLWVVASGCFLLALGFLYVLYTLLGRLLEKDTESNNERSDSKNKAKLLLWALIGLVWACSCLIFAASCNMIVVGSDIGNVVTVLFGASSIALFIFSLFVALLAIMGWQSIRDYIGKSVTEEIRSAKKSLEDELKGRVYTVLGYAIGEMSLNSDFNVADKGRLEQAVHQCRAGYEYLQKVQKEGVQFLGLNNLIFYLCVLRGGEKHKADEVYMLTEARRLRDAGEKNDSAMLKLTAARVFLEYRATTDEKAQALAALRMLAAPTSRASEREKTEAMCYLKKHEGDQEKGLQSSSPELNHSEYTSNDD